MSTDWCQEIGNLSILILSKLAFLESLLFHYFMINTGYNEQNIGFRHAIMVQEAYYYLRNNIKQIVIHS